MKTFLCDALLIMRQKTRVGEQIACQSLLPNVTPSLFIHQSGALHHNKSMCWLQSESLTGSVDDLYLSNSSLVYYVKCSPANMHITDPCCNKVKEMCGDKLLFDFSLSESKKADYILFHSM